MCHTMIIFLLLIVVPAFFATGTTFTDCGKKNIQSVQVNDCQGESSCPLVRGRNSSITVVFEAEEDSKTATSSAHGIFGPIPVPYQLPDTNGCHGMSPGCPIKKGTTITYKTQLFVKKEFPSIKLAVKWEEIADSKDDIFCLIFAAEVK